MERRSILVACTTALVGALLAVPFLSVAGVPAPVPTPTDDGDDGSAATPATAPGVEPGRWWAFEVTVREERAFLAAVIVHEVEPETVRVGTNRSGSILGVPFGGNFTGDLNPEYAGQTWRMYDFPLHDGKAWDQEFLGHTLNTTVEEAQLPDPEGNGTVDGYRLEATAYGRAVATYTYHPSARWLSQITINEPRSGDPLVEADLVAYGASWDEAYYVNEAVHSTTVEYPTEAPGQTIFTVPDGYERARVQLSAVVGAGGVDADVRDEEGRTHATSRVLVRGSHVETATVEQPAGEWTFAHAGTGDARVHLEVLGVRTVDPASDAGGDDDRPLEDAIPGVGQASTVPPSRAW